MNSEGKRFIKEICKIISFNSKDKKKFIKLLQTQIEDYSNTHTNCNYESLVTEFGTPNEIAASYIEELDTPTLLQYLNKRKLFKIIISITVVAILTVWSFKLYRLNQLYEIAKQETQLCEQTTITEEGE